MIQFISLCGRHQLTRSLLVTCLQLLLLVLNTDIEPYLITLMDEQLHIARI